MDRPPLNTLQLSYIRRRPRLEIVLPALLSMLLWGLIIWGTAWLVLR